MKTLFPKALLLLMVVGILLQPQGFSQTTLGAPETLTVKSTGSTPLKLLKTSPGGLREVVDLLQEQLESEALEPINVIFGPGTETKLVPELLFRNVSGPDALQLIATAADCEAEPLLGVSRNVIGYRLTSTIRPSRPSRAIASSRIPATPRTAVPSRRVFQESMPTKPPGASEPQPFDFPETEAPKGGSAQTSSFRSGAGPQIRYGAGVGEGASGNPNSSSIGSSQQVSGYTGGGSRVYTYGGTPAAETRIQNTRVYPLAAITASTEFNEIEATMTDLLKVDGKSSEDVKLVFHDKTGVLVVRGTEHVHVLVSDLLESLTENQREVLEKNSVRDLTQLRIELEAQFQAKNRLQEQLARAEADARALAKENSRLKDMLGSK